MLSILGSIIATTMIIQIIEGFQDSDIWNKSVKNSIKNLQVFTLCALPSYAIAGDILGVVLNYDVDVTNVILSSVAFLIIVGVSIISLILLCIAESIAYRLQRSDLTIEEVK
jgi:sulfite exporter TauE/SafE